MGHSGQRAARHAIQNSDKEDGVDWHLGKGMPIAEVASEGRGGVQPICASVLSHPVTHTATHY